MAKRSFDIGTIKVGDPERILVIPEIGINHEGSLAVAKEMVDAAKRAGARLIKHQTHIVEDEMCGTARNVVPGNSDDSIYDIMARCALNEEEERELKEYVEKQGMLFLSTPFSRAAANRLEKFGVSAYKIGSGELNNFPLIEHIAEFGKPMLVSTGMNDIASVAKAVDIMERYGVDYALLHTTNLYPTKPEWVRLGAMQELMREFPDIPVGLSDHTQNNHACIAAMALGATVVERHFTDDHERTGPDIICSMDETECKELLQAAIHVPKMCGGVKAALPEEQVTMDFAFATAVTICPIAKGDIFTRDNIWVKRPGTGEIKADLYTQILGKRAAEDIDCDIPLSFSMIENWD